MQAPVGPLVRRLVLSSGDRDGHAAFVGGRGPRWLQCRSRWILTLVPEQSPGALRTSSEVNELLRWRMT